jgi:uncharacterized delta-60 repeat protein
MIKSLVLFTCMVAFLPIDAVVMAQPADSVQVNWVRQYGSGYTSDFNFADDIAVDGAGNVYVTGLSFGSNQLYDFVTIKYNSVGDTVWVRRFDGPGNNWDAARALALDAEGNVYVTGETYSDSTFFDYLTIKYDAAGNQQWIAQYHHDDDRAVAIALDGSGNVCVTGSSSRPGTLPDYATVKYNNAGQQQWVARYNGPESQADFAVGLALDPSGNVYVTGTSDDLSVEFFPAYATVKYNSDGVQQWAVQYRELWSYANAIALDDSGNAYVTGRSFGLGTYYDYATVKYNATGVQQWVARHNGGSTTDDYAYALAVDASGNVYVTGESVEITNGTADCVTIKYNASGVEQWVAVYNGPGNAGDVGNDIALDAGGNIYVTGESRGPSGADDYATIKYNPEGVEQWVVRYDSGPGDTFDLPSAIAVDASRNVYVTGRSARTGESIITTIKYAEIPVSVKQSDEDLPAAFMLEQNYPNPFNPSTVIRFSVPRAGFLTLKVFNMLGEEITTLVSDDVAAGAHQVQWQPQNVASGVYVCRLQAGAVAQTRKLVLIR